MIFLLFLFVCTEGLLDLPEGSLCEHNGLKGKCVHAMLCPTVTMVVIPQRNTTPESYRGTSTINSRYIDRYHELLVPPLRKYVEESSTKGKLEICSFNDKDPIICCTDCNIETKDHRKAVVTVDGYRYKTGRSKAWDQCLENIQRLDYPCKEKFDDFFVGVNPDRNCTFVDKYFKTAVFNGKNAKRREFPHMALVGFGDKLDSVQWLCGGSIISKRYILTAAHCASHTQLGPASYVAMGILNRNDPAELWVKYKVRRFINHPQYTAPIKYHDIALIETDEQISFSKDVLPICLAEAAVADNDGVVVGWGATGYKKQVANTLQKAWVEKFSEKNCDDLFPVHRNLPSGVNRTSQTCYGDVAVNTDTCEGDSGGPLQVTRNEVTTCVSFVVGVTSFGRACGFKGSAGIYTKVLPYIPWIESVVWP